MSEVAFKVKFGKIRPAKTSQRPVPGFVAPQEAETPGALAPAQPRRPVSRTARLLALAYYVERQIEAGVVTDYAEAARALGMSRARMTQVMDLVLLPTRSQEAILTGKLAASERRLRTVPREAGWEAQDRPRGSPPPRRQ